MQEKIPQNALDKMSLIASRMQDYAQRYDENSVYREVVRVGLEQLSSEIVKLARSYDIQEIKSINSNHPIEDCIEHAFVICDQVENIKFLNELKDDDCSIVFDAKWKGRIRTYVVTIKTILDNANIENERLRNSIFSKLNAFSAELDKTKTSVQSFQDAFLEMTLVAGQSAENIKPAVSLGLKVMRAFGHLIDIADHPQLPPPDDHKLLPPPNENEDDQ